MICRSCEKENPCTCDCHKNPNLISSDHEFIREQAGLSDEEIELAQKNEYKKRFGEEKGLKLYLQNLKK
jgi:hypothetical protein